ncbi:MAG: two-component sensor histidine kinase, partial [Thermodesulfobacteriota bacterium]
MIADLNIGIRGRLFAAFGIVVGMTLTAAAVGWIVFTRLGDNFEQFVAKNIPAVTLTSQLAESGTTIIGTAPTLAMVINETERQRVWE